MLAGGVAADHPRLFGGAAARLLPGLVARDRQGASSGSLSSIAKPPTVIHEIIGHADVLPGQCDDVLDLLAEDEHEYRGRAIA